MKNLVLGYIHTSDRKKPEVVQLIHKILDFSPEELEMAMRGSQGGGGGGGGGGWFSGLWGRRQQPTTPKTPPPDKVIKILISARGNCMNVADFWETAFSKMHPCFDSTVTVYSMHII